MQGVPFLARDSLSRSLKDLLHIMELVEHKGARFRSLTESIDTTTPAGRMLMQMVGSFAEVERVMIRECDRRTESDPLGCVIAEPVGGTQVACAWWARSDFKLDFLPGYSSSPSSSSW